MGNVTTGAPGTAAQVSNSGTAQNAILDFTIPQGPTGSAPATQFLTAYSTPSQPGTDGGSLVFDRNGLTQGTAVTHEQNSSDVVLQQPGFYTVSFHGTVAPSDGVDFPLSILLTLYQDGSPVTGANVRNNFQTSSDTSTYAFTQTVQAATAPSTLTVVSNGGSIQYNDIAITARKIGENP